MSHIEKFKDVLNKQEDVEQFFRAVDETLQNIFKLGNDFPLKEYHSSMSLLGGDDFPQSLFMLIMSYDDKEIADGLKQLGNPRLISLTKQLIAKYGFLLAAYNAKRYRPLGIKMSDCSVVNTKNDWLIETRLVNMQGEKIVLRDFSSNFIGLCIEITSTLKDIKQNEKIDNNLIKILENNVLELLDKEEKI
ncbi:MAG: hypothetical protein ACOY31_08815 [Bacillota bacterium]